ncbi:MAG TPA: cyanophycinase [Pyrinomonadaceae bacterium]|nr:cyanophycinase [Pyrinomonadaceae bacterium]
MKQEAGALVIIGGAEDREGECRVLREFVRLAGGEEARLGIVAVASDAPAEVGASYVETFLRLGAAEAVALDISTRQDSNKARTLKIVEEATGVFFTGDDQLRITQLLGGTKLDIALHRRHEAGLALAGTSAGAAMMSSVMIGGGLPVKQMRLGMVWLEAGMDFLPGVLIDQHFEERGRLRRLLVAVAQHPHDLGLGIDEDTAVVVRERRLEVFGSGSVTVVDAGGMTYTNLDDDEDALLAISGVKIHVLPEGFGFDLRNRTPLMLED